MIVRRHSLRLRRPLETSYGTVTERELLVVALTDEDGVTGYGEAAPLQAYDGISLARVERALERYRPVVEGAVGMNGAEIVDACRRVEDLPEAFAAIDLALWDRAGRRTGHPVASLLTDTPAREVPVNATLSALDRTGAAEQARIAVEQGFGCLKVKVGVGDDAGRVAAVRAVAGPHVALRIDANGAWDEATAERVLGQMARYDIELAEQPVATIDSLARLRRRVPVKVAADECIRSVEDAARLRQLDAADAVILKVQPLGGMGNALRVAEAAGVAAIVSSMMETSVGIAVALHLAAALPELPYACGLETAALLEADVVHQRLVAHQGFMKVRRVVPDRDLLSALAVEDAPAPYEVGS